jgi:drug/metabolite transporter (DMT)-like permease
MIGNLLAFFNKNKRIMIMQIFLGNYFVAALFSFFSITEAWQNVRPFDIGIGVISGCLFLLNFIIYQLNIPKNGLSLSVSIMRVAHIVPVFLSVLIFAESIRFVNYTGVFIVIVSFVILADTKNFHNIFWLFLLFIITGTSESMLKIYHEFGLNNNSLYIFLIFASAFIFNLLWLLFKTNKWSVLSLVYGLILGIPNQLTTRFFMKALQTVPGALAFPISASAVVLLVMISDIFIWKKRFSNQQRIALTLLMIGIVFLNIK